ncbi:MAG TPA: hypothetical protein VI028_02960 [Solirubrobacterales bacterium]
MRSIPVVVASAMVLALWGCGGSGSDTTSTTVTPSQPTTTVAAPSGPMVRVCNRTLAREVSRALRSSGYERRVPSLMAAGTQRLSSCDFAKVVEISVDGAPDAVQRYQNRITESAQFAVDRKHFQPQPVSGIGSKSLGAAGANWLPWLNQLLSARGKRVLIVAVNSEALPQSQRLAAAKAVSLAVYDRL